MPLLLPEKVSNHKSLEKDCPCLLCDDVYKIPSKQNEFLTHLLEAHRLVIGDVELISDIPEYIKYWKNKLQSKPIVEFCSVMKSKVKSKGKEEEGKEENLFFLSDVLQEDRELRIQLQMNRLEEVLRVQEMERNEKNFRRSCLFCRTIFDQKYSDLFDHMANDHNFKVGSPNNLVYVEELMDILEKKMEDKVCIYCEKTFKTREVLKEHMRKKGHKKINRKNYMYDKFYLVNYREFGKNWRTLRKEFDGEEDDVPTGFDSGPDSNDEDEWNDWKGDEIGAVCLFCPANYHQMDELLTHMTSIHDFDFNNVRNGLKLDFYQQLKLINFIRRQMHLKNCLFCSEEFDSHDLLIDHMTEKDHFMIPEDRKEWDRPEFFFPTYENDNMLSFLDDVFEVKERAPEVFFEDLPESVKTSRLKDKELRNELGGVRK